SSGDGAIVARLRPRYLVVRCGREALDLRVTVVQTDARLQLAAPERSVPTTGGSVDDGERSLLLRVAPEPRLLHVQLGRHAALRTVGRHGRSDVRPSGRRIAERREAVHVRDVAVGSQIGIVTADIRYPAPQCEAG